jgi:hypothetical protein
MEIRYSRHLVLRLRMRSIPESLPRRIYLRAKRRFFDSETNLKVAVEQVKVFGKIRETMVAYRESGKQVLLITIHPLKSGQLQNRIHSGRWRLLR